MVELSNPPGSPVKWVFEVKESGKRLPAVEARTWFEARGKAAVAACVAPEGLSCVSVDGRDVQ